MLSAKGLADRITDDGTMVENDVAVRLLRSEDGVAIAGESVGFAAIHQCDLQQSTGVATLGIQRYMGAMIVNIK